MQLPPASLALEVALVKCTWRDRIDRYRGDGRGRGFSHASGADDARVIVPGRMAGAWSG